MTAPSHVSQLMLDALALRALDPASEARVHTHLASCASCREDARIAAELRQRFTAHVLPRGVPARHRRRRSWLWLPPLVAALLAIGWCSGQEPVAELGIKGPASWWVFANRDGRVFAVRDGTTLAAGDRIRFTVIPAGARYLLVASIDALGAATIYFPYGGPQSAIVEADRVEPAGSIELDAAPGPERIYALLSDEPIAADTVIARLRAVAVGGADAIRSARTLELPVRAQLSLVFEKAAP